jgi:drug/metabolite transporter (DMT)-like permease
MDISKLAAIVSVLVALSVASERLVEILKGLCSFLNQENSDKKKEGWRRASLQALAVVAGIITALLAQPAIKAVVPGLSEHWAGIVALGLLASGGSGFWNAVLAYVLSVKDIKKVEAVTKKRSIAKP